MIGKASVAIGSVWGDTIGRQGPPACARSEKVSNGFFAYENNREQPRLREDMR